MESLPPDVLAQDISTSLYVAVIVPRVLACIAVALRVVARRIGGTKLWWDDWIIIVSTLCVLIPETGLELAEIVLGSGRHIEAVLADSPQNLAPLLKVVYVDALTYPMVIAPVKASILMLYIRLFGVHRRFKIWCYCLLAISCAWGIITFFFFVFQCNPISSGWSATRVGCMQYAPLFIGTNIPNVIIDFIILGTPVPVIWNLKLPITAKITINAILALGIAEVALSIVRVSKLGVLTFEDLTWDDAPALVWSCIECNIGTICCCVPVYGPLLPRSIRAKMSGTSTGRQDRYYRHSDNFSHNYNGQKGSQAGTGARFTKSTGDRDNWGDIRLTTDIQTEFDGRRSAKQSPPSNSSVGYD